MKKRLMILAILAVAIGVLAVTSAMSKQPAKNDGPGYTENPTFEKIPNAPIKGIANGRPFEAQAVYFEPSFGKWSMMISDVPLNEPTGLIFDAQTFNINLPELPAPGKNYTRAMKYGDGFFQVQTSDKRGDTTSWNTDNAYVLEITKWDVNPYDEGGKIFQHAGSASGRIYIVYKGGTNIKESWAAGTFTDAPVRFMGKPEMKY
jgi:hypothetical protein